MTERFDDEAALAARAQQGDEDAFAVLVRRHASIAHRVAYVITRNSADADDALQDGAMRAWRNMHRFDPARPFRPWFVTIVANAARNRARAWSRHEALQLRVNPEPPGSDPADAVVAADEGAALLRLLDGLPARYRSAVTLRHVIGMSESETAAALGIRPGTVKSRVSRGLEQLREAMGGEWT